LGRREAGVRHDATKLYSAVLNASRLQRCGIPAGTALANNGGIPHAARSSAVLQRNGCQRAFHFVATLMAVRWDAGGFVAAQQTPPAITCERLIPNEKMRLSAESRQAEKHH
jgi:hypothetical protein